MGRRKLPIQGGREGGESGEQPSLNSSSQLRQGRKTVGFYLLGIEEVVKSHESMMENHWELCRMITHKVK